MKFNCGESAREKAVRLERSQEWVRWFAWYPIRIKSGDCRWLEFVEYRASWYFAFFGMVWTERCHYRGIK